MKIITSGASYLDIDAYACCIAYAELLNLQGIPARAVSSAQPNASVSQTVLGWAAAFDDYLPTLVINAINITKEAQSTFFQFPNATFNEYNPGRTILVGIRGRF